VELVRRKLVPSRAAAREAITSGRVEVGGVPLPKPATLVAEDSSLRLTDAGSRYVGRGGLKLEAALATFPITVSGARALDVGASTGGFTDCLLQHGADAVTALDVGYGQLDWSVRSDPRVTVVERTNFRHADPKAIGAPFDVVVADLSFISLVTVAAAFYEAGSPDADYVLLVKPQFEVGKGEVGKGGVVREPALHAAALEKVTVGLASAGIGLLGAVASPVTGAKGNREFLVWGRKGSRTLSEESIGEVVTG
jgi:23S rRNA (cytidine1920-2'-O)/16S rRNA (cytidine1409-2'-O)-methyltransferase